MHQIRSEAGTDQHLFCLMTGPGTGSRARLCKYCRFGSSAMQRAQAGLRTWTTSGERNAGRVWVRKIGLPSRDVLEVG